MAGQAGWYHAPGEAGLLRYWNGTVWTTHRQPMPDTAAGASVAVASVAAPTDATALVQAVPDEATDPMAEYERQFASAGESAAESVELETTRVTAEPLLVAAGHSTHSAAPLRALPTHPGFVERDFSPAAGQLADPSGPLVPTPDRLALEAPAVVVAPTPVLAELAERDAVAPVADAIDRSAEARTVDAVESNRRGLVGALIAMSAGVLILLVGLAVVALLAVGGSVGAGEAQGTGIVTSLGSTTGNSCTPVARFAVAGKSYRAGSTVAISPCPVGLGQSVDVIYSAVHPASHARVEMSGPATAFLWLIPVLGGLLFLGGLFIFIVRAGSIAAGIGLIRDGRRTAGMRAEPALDESQLAEQPQSHVS